MVTDSLNVTNQQDVHPYLGSKAREQSEIDKVSC